MDVSLSKQRLLISLSRLKQRSQLMSLKIQVRMRGVLKAYTIADFKVRRRLNVAMRCHFRYKSVFEVDT